MSAIVSSATPSALRPGARSTGIPAAVAPATSTLLGSPRHEPIATSGTSNTGPFTESDSTMRMSAPSSTRRAASFSPFRSRSGTCSIQGSYTTSASEFSVSQPSPRKGAVTNALCRSATPHPRAWLTQASGPVSNVCAVPIHYEQDAEHVVLITIDRPEARNAADMAHFKALREAWERFEADDQAWVAIVPGVGEAFFAGADLKTYIPEITKFQKRIADEGLTEVDGYRLDDGTKSVLRNWPLYKPIIAAVNGFCTAGGMEMLGGCDIRLACPEAKFAVMEPKRGLFAGGGTTVRLPRQIPWPQAMEFLLCADLIPAERAYEMGLLNAVVPRDQLLAKAREYADRMIANAPLAVQATKESALKALYVDEDAITQIRVASRALSDALQQIDGSDPATAQGAIAASVEVLTKLGKELRTAFEKESRISSAIFQTDDAKEGPRAFAEKRKPVWTAK